MVLNLIGFIGSVFIELTLEPRYLFRAAPRQLLRVLCSCLAVLWVDTRQST